MLTNDFSPEKGTDSQPLIKESPFLQITICHNGGKISRIAMVVHCRCVFLSFHYQETTITTEWNIKLLTSQLSLGMMNSRQFMNQSSGGNGKASNEEPLSHLVKLRMDLIRQQAAPMPYPALKRCSSVVFDDAVNDDDVDNQM